MPFIYNLQSKMQAENFQTSGSTNTEIDAAFIRPGASRVVALIALRVQGKAAGLTALSGIAVRIKQWTTTASSGGTAVTPNPVDNLAPACVATAGMGTGGGTSAVTSGTGGPNLVGGCGMGASGPGAWTAPNPDGAIVLDGGAAKSTDLFSSSGTASLNYEFQEDIQE
jgi:hypothetical protein